MKLYLMPGACSLTEHIALEWIGADYETQAMSHEELKSPEYLKLNPQGSVPCLVDGDFVLSQNLAILFYLDESYPQAHLFGGSDKRSRATAMRWLAFCNSDLHKAFGPLFAPAAFGGESQALQDAARAQVNQLLAIAEAELSAHDHLGGERSVADAYFFVILRWAQGLQLEGAQLPHVKKFFARMMQDAGVKKALQAEGLQ